MQITTEYTSPLGELLLAADEGGLIGVWFRDAQHFGSTLREASPGESPVLSEAAAWLDRYFAGETPGPRPPLHLMGTPFQKRVWEALLDIPYGKTVTYGDLAEQVECQSARAVGSAVGRNPVSLLVPCHRVVGQNGSLTGYAGGLWRKQRLLRLEREGPKG